MVDYQVSIIEGITYIEHSTQGFRMDVQKDRKLKRDHNTAVLEATLYIEEGVFIKKASYIFEALSNDNNPLIDNGNIDHFKDAVDFFFKSILNTDLYIKSIPKASSLCQNEMKMFQYDVKG
jgi:hypothetical protein